MSSAWLLPEHIADVLPAEARQLEHLRRRLLEIAGSYGFEQVMPPLLEHLSSLLVGTADALDLRTFKLVDQLSGRTLGVRADTTPQVARIDAHLLNRQGVTRLCYCAPVLHTLPQSPGATREPLQFGAEIYGHAGLEADLEVHELALDALDAAGVKRLVIDLADARIVRAAMAGLPLDAAGLQPILEALASKNRPALQAVTEALPQEPREALRTLATLYGGREVLADARTRLPARPAIGAALDDLATLADHLEATHAEVQIGFDLADVGAQAYYTGPRFSVYAHGASEAVLRGGRYDEIGADFGRNRPAVGFSADLKQLAACAAPLSPRQAVRAPWGDDPALRAAVRELRARGETVVRVLPGHDAEAQEFDCDRELLAVDGRWMLRAL